MRSIKKVNLDELYEYLIEAFDYVNKVSDQECVIAFGNTGCGKSTMLNSLVWGSSSLKLEQITEEYEVMQKNQMVKKVFQREVIGK